jgi:tRNA A37 threonylcarbamoyladenosine dehydratase
MKTFPDRTLPILGQEGFEALSAPLIAFAGLGGVGGGAFLNLVRCGVKRFRLSEKRIEDAARMGKHATTSIGGSLSGVLLASEVLAYFLGGTNIVNRGIIFAPKFVAIDLLRAVMEVVDVTAE